MKLLWDKNALFVFEDKPLYCLPYKTRHIVIDTCLDFFFAETTENRYLCRHVFEHDNSVLSRKRVGFAEDGSEYYYSPAIRTGQLGISILNCRVKCSGNFLEALRPRPYSGGIVKRRPVWCRESQV